MSKFGKSGEFSEIFGGPVCPLLAPQFLVDANEAARLCGVGKSLWYELVSVGRTPAAVKFNSKSLWSYEQLKLWTFAGCPSQDSSDWQRILRGK